jgi:hypothetical protein
LSMIIQPLCSFSTYLFIFFLCHTPCFSCLV